MFFQKKYKYNKSTLQYEKVGNRKRDVVKQYTMMLCSWIIGSVVFSIMWNLMFKSPSDIKKEYEYQVLLFDYMALNKKLNSIEKIILNFEERDNYIYRQIFEVDNIPAYRRQVAQGGVNNYDKYDHFDNETLIKEIVKKVDNISHRIYIQSKSFDELYELTKRKKEILSCTPAIIPIENTDLSYMASGYGYRIHPILKVKRMHEGMDFVAKKGTPVRATADGIVQSVKTLYNGYGKYIIINHSYGGYRTLYAHLSGFNVKKRDKVKRGQVIGYVGNTGTSTGPHLHYEVIKDGKKVNPVHYYYKDIKPNEYAKIIEQSAIENQSFD